MVVDGVSVIKPWSANRCLQFDGPRQRDQAPVTSIWPAPCDSASYRLPSSSSTGIEVSSRTAFTAFGDRSRLACSTSATTPLATPAAMLVPRDVATAGIAALLLCETRVRYRRRRKAGCRRARQSRASRNRRTTKVRASCRAQRGRRRSVSVLNVRAAPAVDADGALPGEVMPP